MGDWHRIFEPLHDEHDYVIHEIDGALPGELVGTLYRNGPGKWEQGGSQLNHLLEGDGMVSAFSLDGRSVRYRNRYVRTPTYARGLGNGGIVERTTSTLIPGGPAANAGRPIAKHANTNVILHGGRLLAYYGSSLPWQLDADTLDTLGQVDHDGMLGAQWPGVTAHPKIDPATGDMFTFLNTGGPQPALHCFRIDAHGRGAPIGSVAVSLADFVHDMAITERHLIFAIAPYQYDLASMLAGEASPLDALGFRDDLATTFVIVPKDGGPARIVEHEAFPYIHVLNAYEDGDDIVLDLDRYEQSWEEVNRAMFAFRTGPMEYFAARTTRYRITSAGKVLSEPLSDFHSEWPQLDWRFTGRRHRFSYHAVVEPASAAGGLGVIDNLTGTSLVHRLPASNVVGEPSFVPRSPTAVDGDGWVLFTAYDPTEHRSRMIVLDAGRIDAEPVAVAYLRHHLPLTFHGSFTTRVAA